MKKIVLLAVLVLGSAGLAVAQSAAKTPVAAQTPVLAPLPNEADQKLGPDTGSTAAAPAPAPSTDITIWTYVQMVLILALVIGMIVGFLWFLRRLSGQGKGGDAPIRVLHTQGLGGSRTLQVVEVADEVLLLGVADGGIQLLKDLTGTETGDAFRLRASRTPASGGKGFSDLLGGLMGLRPKIRPDVAEPVENSTDFLKKQRERLKKL